MLILSGRPKLGARVAIRIWTILLMPIPAAVLITLVVGATRMSPFYTLAVDIPLTDWTSGALSKLNSIDLPQVQMSSIQILSDAFPYRDLEPKAARVWCKAFSHATHGLEPLITESEIYSPVIHNPFPYISVMELPAI